MRGALPGALGRVHAGRIIPADAGSTARLALPDPQMGDHPRGCGEHIAKEPQVVREHGSSPRMRGALRTWK